MADKKTVEPISRRDEVREKTKFRSLSELPGERMLAEGRVPPEFVPDAAVTKGDYLLVIYDPESRIALASLSLWLHEPDSRLDILGMTNNVKTRIAESGLGYGVGDYYVEEGKLDDVEVDDAHDLGIDYTSVYKGSSDLDTELT